MGQSKPIRKEINADVARGYRCQHEPPNAPAQALKIYFPSAAQRFICSMLRRKMSFCALDFAPK